MRAGKSKILSILLLLMLLVITACIGSPRSKSVSTDSEEVSTGEGNDAGSGNNSGNDGEQNVNAGEIAGVLSGKTQIRHIIDPFDGTYKTKVTIPKNFTGYLYLSGLNITSLRDRLVSVRFNFGREMEPVIIPAIVGRGEGIIPNTDIEVLIMDFNTKPFENIRIHYDLFDYTDYDTDDNGTEASASAPADTVTEPLSNPRDGGLYCRGLRLEHDPTFTMTATTPTCSNTGDKYLYTYAKIVDSGLMYNNGSGVVALTPSEPQLDLGASGYTSLLGADALKKCLPDNDNVSNFSEVLNTSLADATKMILNPLPGAMGYGLTTLSFSGTNYTYFGPYYPAGESSWEISGGALFSDISVGGTSPTGLFQDALETTIIGGISVPTVPSGYKSFMFPRAYKRDITAGVEYYGSDDPFGVRSLDTLLVSGESKYMDGCNARIASDAQDSISACNVTATIEIVTVDPATNAVTVLSDSTDVKLQLIRASATDYMGQEVLHSAMTSCSSSNSCGSGECCFNSRCWAKTLVSACYEDSDTVGQKGTGQTCASDFECSSLCCNQSTNKCQVHMNVEGDQVLCSKSPGQTCISQEYCRKENIPVCFKVRTGISEQGVQQCALRCYNQPTYGWCREGICIAPTGQLPPAFDPINPDCDGQNSTAAIDPPVVETN